MPAFVVRPLVTSTTKLTVVKRGLQGIAGAGGTWGGITGTLANQTDLQSALNGKVALSHLTDASAHSTAFDAKLAKDGGTVYNLTENQETVTTAINLATCDNNIYKTLTADQNFTVTGTMPAGKYVTLWCLQDGTGGWDVEFNTGGGVGLAGTADAIQPVVIYSDGTSVWPVVGAEVAATAKIVIS